MTVIILIDLERILTGDAIEETARRLPDRGSTG
jgi:hypothetical protein